MRRHRKIDKVWTCENEGILILLAFLAPFLIVYGIYRLIKKVVGF